MESIGTELEAEKQAYNCFSLLNEATGTENTAETTYTNNSEDDVIAAFPFDYALMEDFKVGWAKKFRFNVAPAIVRALPVLRKFFFRRRVQWDVYSQYLCLTREGIRFICDKRKNFWGCTTVVNRGKTSKFIPFDSINECDVEERKGGGCLNSLNSLTCIVLDNASKNSSDEKGVVSALVIFGLMEPQKFKQLLLALKNSNRKYGKLGINATIYPLTDEHTKPNATTNENAICSRYSSCFIADTLCGVGVGPSLPEDARASTEAVGKSTSSKPAAMLQLMCCGPSDGGLASPVTIPMRA
jgi:hypothetical protein